MSFAIYGATISKIYVQPSLSNQAISMLVQSLNEKNPAILAQVLAPEYKVGHLKGETAREALDQIITNYPRNIRGYTFQKEEKQADGTIEVEILMHCSDGHRTNRFRLNAAGMFTELGLIAPKTPFQPKTATYSSKFTVPFRLQKNLILLAASVNGREGYFLLDTGTRAMTLNATFFPPTSRLNDGVLHLGAQGSSVTLDCMQVDEFVMGEMRLRSFDVAVKNLDHVGVSLNVEIAGIIGFEQLADFEVYFDYEARQITFYSLDAKGCRLLHEKQAVPEAQIPFELVDHIPVIDAIIGNVRARFAVDSGVSVNVINQALRAELNADFTEGKPVIVTSVWGAPRQYPAGRVRHIKIDGVEYPEMETIVSEMPLVADSTDNRFPAMLGYEFLSRQPVSINFRSHVLFIWKPQQP
ncbi:MAG: retropepsin-like aspartic protease [Candidatus Methylacidiphilales bacterium]